MSAKSRDLLGAEEKKSSHYAADDGEAGIPVVLSSDAALASAAPDCGSFSEKFSDFGFSNLSDVKSYIFSDAVADRSTCEERFAEICGVVASEGEAAVSFIKSLGIDFRNFDRVKFVGALINLTNRSNPSARSRNELLLYCIEEFDKVLNIAASTSGQKVSCLNMVDAEGHLIFAAAAEQGDCETAIKLVESRKISGLKSRLMVDFFKFILSENPSERVKYFVFDRRSFYEKSDGVSMNDVCAKTLEFPFCHNHPALLLALADYSALERDLKKFCFVSEIITFEGIESVIANYRKYAVDLKKDFGFLDECRNPLTPSSQAIKISGYHLNLIRDSLKSLPIEFREIPNGRTKSDYPKELFDPEVLEVEIDDVEKIYDLRNSVRYMLKVGVLGDAVASKLATEREKKGKGCCAVQ